MRSIKAVVLALALVAIQAAVAWSQPINIKFEFVRHENGPISQVFPTSSMDPSTGKFYQRNGYFGETSVAIYADAAAFESNHPSASIQLAGGGFYGTYFQVRDGKLYGRGNCSDSTVVRWDATTGAREEVAQIPGMGGQNFNWGGCSGVNWMQDSAHLYVVGNNLVGGNWQIDQMNADLNMIQMHTFAALQIGSGFIIGGTLFTSPSYNSTVFDNRVDLTTGAQQQVQFVIVSPPVPSGCCGLYFHDIFYDPNRDTLYVHANGDGNLYRMTHASQVFGVQTNRPPTAAIAPHAAVHAGDLVVLDGSGSTDSDGNALTYHWTLVSVPPGSSAALSDPGAVLTSFTADKTGDYQVSLVVNDGLVDSAPATLLVSSFNGAPVADAGPDQLLTLDGTRVQLDGSGSTDPDNDPLTYAWTLVSKPAGSAAILNLPGSADPSFIADVNGQYDLSLQVTDPFGASSTDAVTVSFNNLAPVADAGPDQTPVVGTSVSLPGSGSDANGDPLTFRWSLLSIPAGSTAALTGGTTDLAGFTADRAGTYVAQLIVNDGIVDSTPDTVTIQAITAKDAATMTLQELIAYLSGLPPTDGQGHKVFVGRGTQKALAHQLQTALRLIERGKIREALQLLTQDVRRLDGCSHGGTADRNDWIRVCTYQTPAYALLTEAISYLEEVPRNGHIRRDRHNRHDRDDDHDRHSGGERHDR